MMYHTDKTILFFNGHYKHVNDFRVSPFNQTLHYGYGVFDGLRAYNTQQGSHIFKARRHFDRLIASAQKMGISVPYTTAEMVNYAYELIERNQMKEAYIRPLIMMDKNMTLRADNQHPNILMTCWKWSRYFSSNHLDIMVSSWRRPHPRTTYIDVKIVGHYTNAIFATREAIDKGYDEAIMLDMEGYVAQGPGCSFFYEKDGTLITPPTQHIFPGITRLTIIEIAKQMGIEGVEKSFGVEEIIHADGAFFCGTATEIAGIASINGSKMKHPWEDTIGKLLHDRYKRIVSGKDTNFLEYF